MGASAKTLSRLISLHQRDLLRNGASIIELGAQQLFCRGQEDYVREVIRYFAEKNPGIARAESYDAGAIARFSDKALLGHLLTACGFAYRALDIFEAPNTTLFDLNLHSPGPELCGQFDLVTNLGTTEHVINQMLSMKTMHDLTKSGGLIYHDLPMAGYHYHGYFSYNPLLFHQLAAANDYRIILQYYSKGGATRAPAFMADNGYADLDYTDRGIEFILQKTTSAPFRLPLETSTSLGVSKTLWADENPYGEIGPAPDSHFNGARVSAGWRASRDIIGRLKRKLRSRLTSH